jgi:hypothetical protein
MDSLAKFPQQPPRQSIHALGTKLLGALVVLIGIAIVIAGVAGMINAANQSYGIDVSEFGTLDPDESRYAIQISNILWGIFLLTSGRYIYRAAGKRGTSDRLGRILIIVGYAVIILGATRAVRYGMFVESTPGFLANFFGFGIPGAIVAQIGMDMSDEKPLLGVTGKATDRLGN